MTTHRFEIKSVNELNHEEILSQPSEIVPLLNRENNIPAPPPLSSSLTLINETNKPSTRLFNTFLQRLKTSSSAIDLMRKNDLSSFPTIHSSSIANLNAHEEATDSPYATIHSNIGDTNSLHNKFLHELRSKRRELHDKAKNLPIDQRIALHRHHPHRNLTRAQDIFDVHFELDDDNDNIQYNVLNEDTQELIRNKIFHELDRQRMKQFHKQHRQLVFGRALLIFITLLILFMSITLIYVVMNLYNRANYLEGKLADNEFLSMDNDIDTDV